MCYLYNPSACAGEPGTEKTLINVSESDREKFRAVLDKIKVCCLEKKDDNPQILDRTSWILEAVYSDKAIETSSSNKYPEHLANFLDAVDVLMKGDTFSRGCGPCN